MKVYKQLDNGKFHALWASGEIPEGYYPSKAEANTANAIAILDEKVGQSEASNPDAPSVDEMEKEDLQAFAESQGIEFDRRWGVKRLAEVVKISWQ